jgi:hypothetical protein
MGSGASIAAERRALLDATCIEPCAALKALFREFRAFVRFLEEEAPIYVCGHGATAVDVAALLEAEAAETYPRISVAAFEATLAP